MADVFQETMICNNKYSFKDTEKKQPSNKTPALMKSMIMGICIAVHQILFIRVLQKKKKKK